MESFITFGIGFLLICLGIGVVLIGWSYIMEAENRNK
jgi:hypothetical protein